MVMIWSDLNGNIKHVGLPYGQGLANLAEHVDEFKCHPLHMNYLRHHYKEILAELAESNVLNDLLSQLYGEPCTFEPLSFNLSAQIRNSNYALC